MCMRSRRRYWVLACAALMGCQAIRDRKGGEDGGGREEPEPKEARVSIEVPDGLAVSVDGAAKGTTPIDAFSLSPGKHEVAIAGPCGTVSATLETKAGRQAKLSTWDFEGMKVARLKVSAKTLDGTSLSPAVHLGDWRVPGDAREETLVPACALRLRVEADGLGGFIEDIDPSAGEHLVRDVVLAPGPDMVRIHGGPFRIGPPGPDHYDPDFWDNHDADDDVIGWPWIETHDVQIETFDIDRTEVTAEQFHACYKAGGCVETIAWNATRTPDDRKACSTDVLDKARTPGPGRLDFPANCAAKWEAEQYCKWAGKRLPTDVEWEYAARSRKAEYACSWGGGFDEIEPCDRSPSRDITAVCSHPEDDTEQGLCDMMGNAHELVTGAEYAGRRPGAAEGIYKGGYGRPFEGPYLLGKMVQSEKVGFRCARDITAGSGRG
jgi:formylglycine-generating enzyme required for sulfatase activity